MHTGSGLFIKVVEGSVTSVLQVHNNLLPDSPDWVEVTSDPLAGKLVGFPELYYYEGGQLHPKMKATVCVNKKMIHADGQDQLMVTVAPQPPEGAAVLVAGTTLPIPADGRPLTITTSVPGIVEIRLIHPYLLASPVYVVASSD